MFIFDDRKATNGKAGDGSRPRGLGFSWTRRAESNGRPRALGRRPRIQALGVVREGRIGTTTVGSMEELGRELDRSRRYGHSFVLLRIPCLGREAGGCSAQTAEAVRAAVRRVDSVWTDGYGVYLLAPEADRAVGAAMLARLRRQLTEHFEAADLERATFVVFPEEGPTSGALLEALLRRVRAAGRAPAERDTTVDTTPAPESGV
jgi:hypothetical protein